MIETVDVIFDTNTDMRACKKSLLSSEDDFGFNVVRGPMRSGWDKVRYTGNRFMTIVKADVRFYPGWFSEIRDNSRGVDVFSVWSPRWFNAESRHFFDPDHTIIQDPEYRMLSWWCITINKRIFRDMSFEDLFVGDESWLVSDMLTKELRKAERPHVLVRNSLVDRVSLDTPNLTKTKLQLT